MMEKEGIIALFVVAIVAAVGLGMVFSTGSDVNIVGHAIEPVYTLEEKAEPIEQTATPSSTVVGSLIADDCNDPDGPTGLGSATTVTQTGYLPKTDACIYSTIADGVMEAYCSPTGPDYHFMMCPEGTVCQEGRCMTSTSTTIVETIDPMPEETCTVCEGESYVFIKPASASEGRLTGAQLCELHGKPGCLMAYWEEREYFYMTEIGICQELQAYDFRPTPKDCTARPALSGRCRINDDARYAEPKFGDYKKYSRLEGALCIS